MLLPLQQHPHFAACLRANGRQVVETAHGHMLLRRVGPLPVGLISRGRAEMLDAPRPKGCTVLFTPDDPSDDSMRGAGFWRLRAPVEVAEWDISHPTDKLAAQLRKTWRHGLEPAQDARLKLSITSMPPSGDHWLLIAEQRQARERGYRALPLWLTRAWATLHPKDATLIEARRGGELVAGMVFLRHGKTATYHISHATPLGKKLGAHRLMLWRAAAHFARKGVVRLDLGTLDRANAPGLAQFKLGTGAKARGLGGTWISLPGLSPLRRQLIRQVPSGQKA